MKRGPSWDFSQKNFIVTKYFGRVFMKLTTGWPGLVPGVSRFSLSLYLCIVLISANEVNLCQDLTNYLLLGVTRASRGAGDIWCIVKHAGTHGLAWPPPPPSRPFSAGLVTDDRQGAWSHPARVTQTGYRDFNTKIEGSKRSLAGRGAPDLSPHARGLLSS